MIAADLHACASDNLVETYFRLGLAAPQSGIWEDEGFRACLGGFDHPICNFALRLRLDRWSAQRLQALAVARPSLYVYSLSGEPPELGDQLLWRVDFREIHCLTTMIADAQRADCIEMAPAVSVDDRNAVSSFMAGIFFASQDRTFRESVRVVTTSARDLELYKFESGGRIAAGVMLSRTPGMLGIYNLSVAASKRGRGLGSSIVRWCQDLAAQEGRTLTLQCESSLERWYSSFGFRQLGRVKVFSLLRPGCLDIMESGSVD